MGPSPSRTQKRNSSGSVLVTGGSGGIGRAVCLAFARAGWTVGVHYFTRPAEAAKTVDLVRAESGECTLHQADIRVRRQVHAMVDLFVKEHGGLTVLICNAGAAAGQLVIRHRADEWARVIDTTLTGTFHCIQAAGSHMVADGGGSIVVVGSYAGVQGGSGQAAYASAKAGLLGLVRTAGMEWGSSNVRVNLVYPGLHQTVLAAGTAPVGSGSSRHLLGRSPDLDDVAQTIYHLAQLRDTSGQVWNLDSRLA